MTEAAHQMASNPLPPGRAARGHRSVSPPGSRSRPRRGMASRWRRAPTARWRSAGPRVVDGYLDNPEANAASFRDGWFRTGDFGELSADGYLTLAGRIKELINRGGEKIAPHEVEEVLLTHAAVAEAVAFGVPDAKYGEMVARRRGDARTGRRRISSSPTAPTGSPPSRCRSGSGGGCDPQGADRQGPAASPRGAARRVRVAVLGAGAIGAYVGAMLARGGAERRSSPAAITVAAMADRGVRVLTGGSELTVRLPVTDDAVGDRAGRRRLPRTQGPPVRRGRAAARAAARSRHRSGRRPERDSVVVLPRARRPSRRAPDRERRSRAVPSRA